MSDISDKEDVFFRCPRCGVPKRLGDASDGGGGGGGNTDCDPSVSSILLFVVTAVSNGFVSGNGSNVVVNVDDDDVTCDVVSVPNCGRNVEEEGDASWGGGGGEVVESSDDMVNTRCMLAAAIKVNEFGREKVYFFSTFQT